VEILLKLAKYTNKLILIQSILEKESISVNDKMYQLTWQEKTGFIYDANTLKLENSTYDKDIEGWGMTNDGKTHLPDGCEKI
jgi:glutamine cyclotransferase